MASSTVKGAVGNRDCQAYLMRDFCQRNRTFHVFERRISHLAHRGVCSILRRYGSRSSFECMILLSTHHRRCSLTLDGYLCRSNVGRRKTLHKAACPNHAAQRYASPVQTALGIADKASCLITSFQLNVLPAIASLSLPEVTAWALGVWSLFQLARAVTIVLSDAFLQIPNKIGIGILHGTNHLLPSNPLP